jgi:hypothetical protein
MRSNLRKQMKYYTYAYLREDGTPYYIGKGKGYRCNYGTGKNCNPPKDRSRIIKLKQNLTEKEAFKHEVYMIAIFGKKCDGTGILMNIADGGNAPPVLRGDNHPMKKEENRRKVSEKLKGKNNPQWGKPAPNRGVPIKEEVRNKITGEGNGQSQWWKLIFADGRELIMCGLSNWCKENGYDKSKISAVHHKKDGRKKHKDIVAVEKLAHYPPQESDETL